MPEFAQALIDQGKTLAGKGKKALARAPFQAKVWRRMAGEQEEKERIAKETTGIKGWALRRTAGFTKYATKPVRWAYRAAGTTPEMAAREESKTARAEDAKKKMEGQTEEIQRAELQAALKSKGSKAIPRVVGTMEAMMKDGTLEKAEKDGIFGEEEKKKYVKEADNMN